jgi:Uma2 family endonuclease
MSTVPKPRYTPEEYLARERRALTKSEYYQGEIFAMERANRRHCLIVSNLVGLLGNQLHDRPSEVYPSAMRVKVLATEIYTYPDVVVANGNSQFEDEQRDVLLNPAALFEVMSKSTEALDRGVKASNYRCIDSLCELVLIAQDRAYVERHQRQPDGQWMLAETSNLVSEMPLDSIGANLPLA